VWSGLLVMACATIAGAEFRLGVSANDEKNSFFLAIGDHYHVSDHEVVVARKRHIPDDELPVVFFLARECRVQPSVILERRLRGESWLNIGLHFGCGPDVYYYPVEVKSRPPYGRAYGYYKRYPRNEWRKIRLTDADVINLVNLRFLSEYGHFAPEEIIGMRTRGKRFHTIQKDLNKARGRDRVKVKGPLESRQVREDPERRNAQAGPDNAFDVTFGQDQGREKDHGKDKR